MKKTYKLLITVLCSFVASSFSGCAAKQPVQPESLDLPATQAVTQTTTEAESMVPATSEPDSSSAVSEEVTSLEESVTTPEATTTSVSTTTQSDSTTAEGTTAEDTAALYRTQADGSPAVGWYTHPDGTLGYCNAEGCLLTGFQDLDGARYLFSKDGVMQTGLYTDEQGNVLMFTPDGKQYFNSTVEYNGASYYFGADGLRVTGDFTFPDGSAGMTDADGKVYTGSHLFGTEVYTFTSLGKFRHKIDATRPMVALTYDDGPSSVNTPVILETLKAYGAYATFFVVGRSVNYHADVIQAIEDSGSEIGNHTYNHFMITNMDAALTDQEISSTSSYVQMITNDRPSIMRPPTGANNEASCANVAAVDNGYPIVLWSIDTLDWQHKDSATTIEKVRSNVRDGSIVLMHDMEASSAEASKTIIPELINMGYELVTVSELAAARGGMIAGGVYNSFYPQS